MGASVGGMSQPLGANASNEDFLRSQYQNYLGRDPDQEGFNYWLGQLNNGGSRDAITQAFSGSDEYKQRQAQGYNAPNLSNIPSVNMYQEPVTQAAPQQNYQNTVNSIYQDVLGRGADQGGLDYWTNQLQSGAMTPDQIRQSFMQSPEYLNKQGNQQTPQTLTQSTASQGDKDFVNSLYKQYLGRDAEPEGLEFWASRLQGGMSPQELIKAIQGSPEYGKYQAKRQADQKATQERMFNPFGNNPFAGSQNPYIQAAQQTSAGNLANAQAAAAANRINQTTPFGSLQFSQTGVDANGNPIWSANQQLAPGLQPAFQNIQNNVAQGTAKPFDVSQTQQQMANFANPEFQRMSERPDLQTNVEGTGMEGWDRANELMMNRLRPQMEQREAALDAKLANRGIMPGTEAYNRARLALSQANNDLMVQSQLAGSQVQNQMFNQNLASGRFRNEALTGQNTMGLANLGFNNQLGQQNFANQMSQLQASNQARQGNYQQNLAAYNNPLQQLAAFREGTNPNYVNYYNQPSVAGPDYFGAYTTANAADIAAQNAANARTANMQAGLFGLGQAALMGSGGVGGLFNLGKQALGGIGSGISSGYDWLTGLGGGANLADYGATNPYVSSAQFMSNLAGGATPFDYSTPVDFLDDIIGF